MSDGTLTATAPPSRFDFGLPPDAAPMPPRERTPLDVVALICSILLAPLGLLLSIVAAALSSRRLGYVNGLVRAALALSIVFTLAWGGGVVAWSYYAAGQAHEAALRSSTQPMCRVLTQRPGVLGDPAFGWPAVSSIAAYQAATTDYVAWWSSVAAAAPAPERAQAAAVVAAAQSAVARMTTSQVVDHDADYADLQAVARASSLRAWAAKYCAG
jgi:hypothetical protein